MENKLNKQFFETKKIHKNNLDKEKKPFKKKIINIIITFVLISSYSVLYKACDKKIEKNKRNDVELQKSRPAVP